jgi:hypothetical protein
MLRGSKENRSNQEVSVGRDEETNIHEKEEVGEKKNETEDITRLLRNLKKNVKWRKPKK